MDKWNRNFNNKYSIPDLKYPIPGLEFDSQAYICVQAVMMRMQVLRLIRRFILTF